MKYCTNCNEPLEDNIVQCHACGAFQPTNTYNNQNNNGDSDSIGWGCLGFCIPIVGLILWLIWRNQYPMKAKKLGIGALANVIVGVVLNIIYFIFTTITIGLFG